MKLKIRITVETISIEDESEPCGSTYVKIGGLFAYLIYEDLLELSVRRLPLVSLVESWIKFPEVMEILNKWIQNDPETCIPREFYLSV